MTKQDPHMSVHGAHMPCHKGSWPPKRWLRRPRFSRASCENSGTVHLHFMKAPTSTTKIGWTVSWQMFLNRNQQRFHSELRNTSNITNKNTVEWFWSPIPEPCWTQVPFTCHYIEKPSASNEIETMIRYEMMNRLAIWNDLGWVLIPK